MTKFKGILFDLDGTLANTMEDHLKAWQAVLKDYGIEINAEDLYPLEGMRLQEIAEKLFEKKNSNPPDPDEIVRKKDEYYLENHSFEFYPGVESFIDYLKRKKILIGMITAGLSERIFNSIPPEFLDKFDAIVTGEHTERGKPFPDPYLKGTELLGLKPAECIAVENAPLGIQSAKSAGMYCIAICTTLDLSYLEEADEIVEKFEDLKKLSVIKQLG